METEVRISSRSSVKSLRISDSMEESMISICMDDFGGEVEDGTGRRDLPKTECEEDFFWILMVEEHGSDYQLSGSK
jgi:hypothetical protein